MSRELVKYLRAVPDVPSAGRPLPDEIELSAVLPVYNEAGSLDELLSRLTEVLDSTGLVWEAILVDDASDDRSAEIVLHHAEDDPRFRSVALEHRSGQSATLAAGFRAAEGDWIVTLDSDLQNPPEEIPRLLGVREGADMVYGTRATRNDPFMRRLSSRVGNAVRNWITGHTVADTGCGLKLFRREAMLRTPLFHGSHRFYPTLFAMQGYRLREVAVKHTARTSGVTKYGVLNRAWRGLIDCFAMRWLSRRGLRYEVKND